MSIFGSINKTSAASSSAQGEYLSPGFDGILAIVACKLVESRANADTFYIIETTVAVTNMEDEHPEGSRASILIKLGDKWNYGLADVKSFLMAATGADESDITEDMAEQSVDPEEQPLAELVFACETGSVPTKAGGSFTKHYFKPVAE